MSGTEKIADIVAELRGCPTNTLLGGMVSLICNRLADRIEAAWKCEREEIYTMLDNSIKSQRRID